jgi:hypothetical protein
LRQVWLADASNRLMKQIPKAVQRRQSNSGFHYSRDKVCLPRECRPFGDFSFVPKGDVLGSLLIANARSVQAEVGRLQRPLMSRSEMAHAKHSLFEENPPDRSELLSDPR